MSTIETTEHRFDKGARVRVAFGADVMTGTVLAHRGCIGRSGDASTNYRASVEPLYTVDVDGWGLCELTEHRLVATPGDPPVSVVLMRAYWSHWQAGTRSDRVRFVRSREAWHAVGRRRSYIDRARLAFAVFGVRYPESLGCLHPDDVAREIELGAEAIR